MEWKELLSLAGKKRNPILRPAFLIPESSLAKAMEGLWS